MTIVEGKISLSLLNSPPSLKKQSPRKSSGTGRKGLFVLSSCESTYSRERRLLLGEGGREEQKRILVPTFPRLRKREEIFVQKRDATSWVGEANSFWGERFWERFGGERRRTGMGAFRVSCGKLEAEKRRRNRCRKKAKRTAGNVQRRGPALDQHRVLSTEEGKKSQGKVMVIGG